MFSVKKTVPLLFTLLVLIALPAVAADLSVKEHRTKVGIVNVAVPYISGSVGGKNVDLLINRTVFAYVNAQMKQILSGEETEIFERSHKDVPGLNDVLRYNSDLVRYTDQRIVDRNTGERVTASWYLRNEYEVKTARDTFYSVIVKTRTYTGGPRDVVVWKAMNFDLKDGKLLELKELFEANADYAIRLQTLIGYQQQGRARLLHHVKGKELKQSEPVTITGQENFYVDNHYNLGIILNAEGNGTSSGETQVYDISLNDFADLIKL